MTKRKILSLLLAVLLVVCALAVVSCTPVNPDEKTEWPEAGEYKFAAGITECTLVLKVGDTFTLIYNGTENSGTYTLTDESLVLDFTAEGKENATATYAGTTVTLTYEGANMVLYKNINYTVSFAANGGSAVASQTVVNGQKATKPETPTRTGYDFIGWYVDASFKTLFNFDAPITANTTLYARWLEDTQLPEPEITVGASSISWKSIAGVRSYFVEIVAPSGEVVYEEETGSTVINFSFNTLDPAIYTVRVTARAQSGEADNSVKEVTYAFRSLDKVTGIQVIDPALVVFEEVENAEKYYVTVVCGDAGHNHTRVELDPEELYYSIANCVMTAEGIKITVTAEAEDFATSVSDTFVYKKVLGSVELSFNSENHTIVWNAVDGASAYMVSVLCGDETHNHEFVNVGTDTFVSVKDCAPRAGGIIVKVYPVGNLALSPEASVYTYNKIDLQTPSEFVINGTTVSWKAVNNATSYEIKVGDQVYTSTTNSFDMASVIGNTVGASYTVSVRALGASATSVWSDGITALYQQMSGNVTYSKGNVTWAPVLGVTGFELQVNDGEIVPVAAGATSAPVVLTKTGVNTVKVRFVSGSTSSEWKSVEVTAYSVTFDTLGGSEIVVQYKAVGDPMALPTATKTGYTFTAWYDVPGGASANGKVYNDAFFAGEESFTVYASYTANEYDVTLNAGSLGSIGATTGTVTFGESFTLDVPVANSPVNAFGGWFSQAGGQGVQYTDELGNSLAPWNVAEDVELHAFWVEGALTLTLTEVNGKAAYMVSAGPRISLLSEVTVPAYYEGLPVAMIAGNAFLECVTLEVLNIPETIEQISSIAPFGGCISLKAINVYEVDNVSGRFWSDNGVLFDNGTSVVADPIVYLMPYAVTGSYTIPDGVTTIPQQALSGAKITEIVIPTSVTMIGREAFANCKNLTSVVFTAPAQGENAAALKIGANAFSGCTALEEITLPARLDEIKLGRVAYVDGVLSAADAEDAFVGCTALTTINVAEGSGIYKSVEGSLYSLDGKTLLYRPAGAPVTDGKLEFAAGTTTIALGAVYGAKGVTEVVIPNTVTLIDNGAFFGMTALTKVTFKGDSLTDLVIGNDAFSGCSNLADLVFEAGCGLTVIGERAFKGCNKLESVEIPGSVTEIKKEAFKGCSTLADLGFGEGTTLAFGEGVFADCAALTTVTLPASVTSIPNAFAGCTGLTAVHVDAANPNLASDTEGVVYNKAMTELILFPVGKTGSSAEYTIPDGVKKIPDGAFKGMTLATLNIPNTIEVIGNEAFMQTKISTIAFYGETFAESLTVGDYAFYKATNFSVTFPKHTKSIGAHAFEDAEYFRTLVLNEGIETIADYAFYNAEPDSWSFKLAIPTTVKSIGAYAFAKGDEFVKVTLDVANSKLEYIGKHAFDGNGMDYFSGIPATVKTIDDYAFAGCSYLGYNDGFTIASGSVLEYIGAHAFDGCGSYLESITIPKSVKTIKAYAFANCGGLKTVTFEEGGTDDLVLGSIYVNEVNGEVERGYAFSGCNNLTSVTLAERVVELGQYCFYNAGYYLYSSNFSIVFGANSRLATIGDYAFHYANLASITIPKSVRNLAPYTDSETGVTYDRMGIGNYAFYHLYDSLTEVIFEGGGTDALTIGVSAFENCKVLNTITLPARLAPYTNSLGETVAPLANGGGVFASNECKGLSTIFVEDGCLYYSSDANGILYNADKTELVLYPVMKEGAFEVPATVKKIGEKAFYYAEKLSAITFAEGSVLEQIGASAFERCKSLVSVTLPTTVKTLGESVFKWCTALESLGLSKDLTAFSGTMVEECSALKLVNVEAGSTYLYSDNGVLYNADKTSLILYPIKREGTSYTVLPTTVRIEKSAFKKNTLLTEIVLNEGLSVIASDAFNGCTALTAVEIPSTVTLLDEWAFSGCSSLETLTFAEGGTENLEIKKYAFQQVPAKTVNLPGRVSLLGDYVFYYAGLESIGFGENSRLAEIGTQVFQSTNLVNVVLPNGVAKIGDGTFLYCESLESVVFGEGLLTIGSSTFEGSSVVSVHFPASLKLMGDYTFSNNYGNGCESLETVTFAPGCALESIPVGTFAGSSLKSIVIPAKVYEIVGKDPSTSYSYGAFQNCTSLTKVEFEDGAVCQIIGAYAFYGCSALAEAETPAAVSTFGDHAFEDCSALTAITVPATVTQFGSSVFRGCSALASVTLLTKATVLPDYTFAYCSSLTEITIPANVESFGSNCFAGTKIANINIAEDNKFIKNVNGVIYTLDMSELVLYPLAKTDATVVISKDVVFVRDYAFADAAYLREVIFEEGGKSPLEIGDYAFYKCTGLNKVVLPDRLASVGAGAFEYCENLLSITIPTNATEEMFGRDAFYGCDKLVEICNKSAIEIKPGDDYVLDGIAERAVRVYSEGESLVVVDENGFVTMLLDGENTLVTYIGSETSIVIPEGITAIYTMAFYESSITGVVFPSTLKSIGDGAFYYSDLTGSVVIGAGVTYVGDSAFYYCSRPTFYVSAAEQPEGWHEDWNYNGYTVIWGFSGEDITYSFVTGEGAPTVDSIVSALPITVPSTLTRDGYIFAGWFTSEDFSGTSVSGDFYSSTDVTLYAKWMTEEEFIAQFAGTAPEYAFDVTNGGSITLSDASSGSKAYTYLKVVATEDVTLTITTAYGADTVIRIYDNAEDAFEAGYNYIESKDSGSDETLTYTFAAGTTYYIVTYAYDESFSGDMVTNVTVG